jgi:hypothetical protein
MPGRTVDAALSGLFGDDELLLADDGAGQRAALRLDEEA